jgi:hypothetical protein
LGLPDISFAGQPFVASCFRKIYGFHPIEKSNLTPEFSETTEKRYLPFIFLRGFRVE